MGADGPLGDSITWGSGDVPNYMPKYPSRPPEYPPLMLEIAKAHALAMEAEYVELKRASERKAKRKQAKASRKRNQKRGK